MMPEPILAIKGLSFAYNGHEVLHKINLEIAAGEYVSIIGPNGAGKSTLLKCLNRIVHAQEGSVQVMGHSLEAYPQKELGKLIGYVPQVREYSFSYSVQEFVMMGRYPYLGPWDRESQEDKKIVENVLALTGLSPLAERRVNTLSGGERQKVYLAASLAQQPKMLLLDEPTTHLDPKHQVEIQHIICDLSKRRKMTVLHVTHDLNHIIAFSDKVVALKHGKVYATGLPCDVVTAENMNNVFEVPFFFLKNPKTGEFIIVPEDKQLEHKA